MGWYAAIKDAASAAQKAGNAELYYKLADVQMEMANLADENARLRDDNRELRERLSVTEKLHFAQNVYWRGEGEEAEGPFCPKCRHTDEKAIPMQVREKDRYWRCFVCGTNVLRPGADPREPRRRGVVSRGIGP